MSKHDFPERWWDPENKVRFFTSNGELWNCEISAPTATVGYTVRLGDI